MFSAATHEVVRRHLRAQRDVRWTMVCHYWTMDYLLPPERAPLKGIGRAWAMDFKSKKFDCYGDGTAQITMTSLDDAARATLAIVSSAVASGEPLAPVTHVGGETMSYNQVFDVIQNVDSSWTKLPVQMTEVVDGIVEGKQKSDAESTAVHQMRLLAFTNANHAPSDRVLQWGEGPLKGLQPTRIKDMLASASL